MKKYFTLFVLIFIGFVGDAQIINVPDTAFKSRLLLANADSHLYAKNLNDEYFKIDVNNNGEIEQSEALQVSELRLDNSAIVSTEGLQYFLNIKAFYFSFNSMVTSLDITSLSNLELLHCANNSQLTSLNITGLINLKKVWCDSNQLTTLNLSGLTALTDLTCNMNQLTSINTTGLTNLKYMTCSGNPLSSLDLSNSNQLKYLACEHNLLTTLDLSNLIALEFLSCAYNQLVSLDASNLAELETLGCQNNQLTSLQLPNSSTNFRSIFCNQNQLTALNLNDLPALEGVFCQNNQLTSLTINNSPNVIGFWCNDNQLTTLDLSSCTSSLQQFACQNNNLHSLFIKNGINEFDMDFYNNTNLEYICADSSQFATIQNKITTYGYENCHVNDYCSFTPGGTFYTIQGSSRYDEDSSGCDANDNSIPFQRFSWSNGTQIGGLIGAASGNYHVYIPAGTYTFSPVFENPNYFNVSSTSANVNFPATASPFIQDFCVTANGTHNDLEVIILPIGPARPGFDSQYKIIYKNKGTNAQSGSISMYYDDTILQLVSANPNTASQGTDLLNWNFTNLLPFESREIIVILNLNSPLETPPVNAGNGLLFSATAVGATDETPVDNTSILNQTVVNSFDPNDKTCIQGTWLPLEFLGKYVHYIIRFENTGTFAAENIVVKDIIDTTKFDMATLVPLSGSHPFVTRVINTNQVEFIFENINLPFDDANNDGYVAFKIKTKTTLVDLETFSNSASIYFDYNAPIITDTYTTTVYNPLNTNEIDFNSVFSLSPVPTKDLLTITAKESLVVTSVSIYNTLGQLIQVNANPSETIDVSGLSSGSYFIKIISDRGSATGKFIKE